MTASQWHFVEDVFLAAVQKEGEERSRCLDDVCAGNEELKGEVKSLLAHERGGTFVLNSIVSHAARKLTPVRDANPGSRIGPYQIVRQLSQGGMGVVYLAVRSDEHYLQTVAIKLVRTGMASTEIISRFRFERQILAKLRHPNIAAMLDAGSTEDGLPYMVMEYIEGQPITEYSRNHQLSVRDRVLLFHSVCFAVHYAHQKLVIHRDIKPGNIFVTLDGIPKLLDFGIARLLPESAPEDLPPTVGHSRIMTPDYASPEQISGAPLTTGADIYSLGVVLFELLTGSRPYSTAGLAPLEVERLVCEESTTKPSDFPGLPRCLQKQLQGDLDSIILMAMRKKASGRYKSVEQFADDLNRYLQGQPILARKDTIVFPCSPTHDRERLHENGRNCRRTQSSRWNRGGRRGRTWNYGVPLPSRFGECLERRCTNPTPEPQRDRLLSPFMPRRSRSDRLEDSRRPFGV